MRPAEEPSGGDVMPPFVPPEGGVPRPPLRSRIFFFAVLRVDFLLVLFGVFFAVFAVFFRAFLERLVAVFVTVFLAVRAAFLADLRAVFAMDSVLHVAVKQRERFVQSLQARLFKAALTQA